MCATSYGGCVCGQALVGVPPPPGAAFLTNLVHESYLVGKRRLCRIGHHVANKIYQVGKLKDMADSFTGEMKEIEFDLIEGLRAEREAQGLSREELSIKLGASENLISKLESHKRGLEAALIVKLAEVYGLTEGTLLRRAKDHAKKLRALRQPSNNVKL